jgi:hypothetical protein
MCYRIVKKWFPAYTGPQNSLERDAVCLLEYFELFTDMVTLLANGIDVCCHQYCSQKSTSSPIPQEIALEEMNVFIVLIFRMGHGKKTSLKNYCKRTFFFFCCGAVLI